MAAGRNVLIRAQEHAGADATALEDNRQLFRSCGFVETRVHAHPGFSEPTWVEMERRLT